MATHPKNEEISIFKYKNKLNGLLYFGTGKKSKYIDGDKYLGVFKDGRFDNLIYIRADVLEKI